MESETVFTPGSNHFTWNGIHQNHWFPLCSIGSKSGHPKKTLSQVTGIMTGAQFRLLRSYRQLSYPSHKMFFVPHELLQYLYRMLKILSHASIVLLEHGAPEAAKLLLFII
jgi:hypothetical protein